MQATHLDSMRTHIISMICYENNEFVLNKVEQILTSDAPCCYSPEELKQRVRQATNSVRAGRGYTAEEMKMLQPSLV